MNISVRTDDPLPGCGQQPPPQSRMHVFFIWMLASSGLGFVKVLVLARILPAADFGHYVTLFGAATLSGTLLSFGLVEATIKLYPRMWVAGGGRAILGNAKAISSTVVKRFLAAAVILALLAAVLELGYSPLMYAVACIIGMGTSLLALIASVLRASDSSDSVRQFNFARSLCAFLLVVSGAWLFGWPGAMVGEASAAALSLLYSRSLVRSSYARQPPSSEASYAAPLSQARGWAGEKLYLANLLSSSTMLADRSFINIVLGAAMAGSYGVLAMVSQIGQLLVNILAQRVGPLVIKAGVAGDHSHGSVARLRTYGLLLLGAMAGLVAALLLARALNIPSGFFDKYQLSASAIMLAGVLGTLQIYGLLEFYLLAQDRENTVLTASVIGSVSFFGLFAVAALLGLRLEWFLGFACAARLTHVGILAVLAKRPRHKDI